MKKLITCALILLLAQKGMAQTTTDNNGFWVVERSKEHPKESLVHYYSSGKILLASEKVEKKLNINRKKVRKQLDEKLNAVVARQVQPTDLAKKTEQ